MPRQRKEENRDLPDNVYPSGKYFYWIHPQTGKAIALGKDRGAAKAKGNGLNYELTIDGIDPSRRTRAAPTISQVIKECRKDILSRYKEGRSRYNVANHLDRLSRLVGEFSVTTGPAPLHDALSNLTDNMYVRYKHQLEGIFAYCYRKEYLPISHTNPATVLEPRRLSQVKRERLTEDEFWSITNKGPDWFQRANKLFLWTLQRPSDICNFQFSDYEEGRWKLKMGKTNKMVAVRLSERERAILRESRATGIASPYVIHRLPERLGRRRKRSHHTQVMPQYWSTVFKRIRDELGIGDKHPPSLYEVRSLGADLYRTAGKPEIEIQALLGHQEMRTTKVYLNERREVYEEVIAGVQNEVQGL